MKHEHSRIYLTSRALNREAAALANRLPRGFSNLKDQLRRASASVTLNFCEGSRHESLAERGRYFRIASGSAAEVSAIADVAEDFGVIAPEQHAAIKDYCNHLCAMLRLYR